jgi:hypothetical protein
MAVTGDTEVDDVAAGAAADAAAPTSTGVGGIDVRPIADEIAAGRLTPREAIDRLVDATAGPGLGAAERAELRALLTDVIANDPVLGALVGRI